MSDIKQQIFQELSTLEDIATRLRSTAVNAGRQTKITRWAVKTVKNRA